MAPSSTNQSNVLSTATSALAPGLSILCITTIILCPMSKSFFKTNLVFVFSSRRRHTRWNCDWSSDVCSSDVLKALGSVLNNKYSEGYPGARYYGGDVIIDKIGEPFRKSGLKLFKLDANQWHANVQPLSGSPANLAVYSALVPIGGKIMGLLLSSGGHLTHGQKMSMTGKIWQQVPYEVDPKTETLDYEALKKLAIAEKTNIIVAGYTAYPRFVDWKKFREIADAAGAILMVDMSHMAGLVAGGVYPSPAMWDISTIKIAP